MGGGLIRAVRRPAGWVAPGPAPRGPAGDASLEPAPDEDLGYLAGDWRVFQKRVGHRWSLDDLVTAFVAARHAEALGASALLDLGCGLGSVLMLLAWRFPGASVTGVEAQADRAELARRSLRYNGADGRCRVVTGDLRTVALEGPFDLVTGTPPYFPRGAGTESDKPHALPCRFEVRGGVEDYLSAAARLLSGAGRAVVCSSALEEARLTLGAAAAGLHVVEHLEVIGREGKQALVMVDVLQRAPGPLVRARLVARDRAGQWTAGLREVREAFGMPTRPP
jgi:tRNA1(Val) A37 N6-methylase TrmN6